MINVYQCHSWLCCTALAGLLAGTWALPAKADVLVTASHTWVSTQAQSDGSYAVTFDVMLSNQGDTDLSAITLFPIPTDLLVMEPESQPLTLDSLAVSTTANINWTVNTWIPTDEALAELPLLFHGDGTDAFGTTVSFGLVSEREVTP
ncbi:hypothetical protein [Marinobacterium aestuariivivens]|uniref:DUF11 domain-containing protein n=1 Tax=Marinobacterium aestuariivivens TaxID=1698799 RepID=A0ABW2A9I6_9GAMM